MTHEDRLIKQIKNGRRECLDELIELYYPAILRYCLWHMPDKESAFRAFLYRIAANTCIDMKRNNFMAEQLTDVESDAVCHMQTACYVEKGFLAAEDRQQLATAFACLDDDARELVLLKYGQELSLREIAALTELPLRTVQTKLRRALSKMKKALGDAG